MEKKEEVINGEGENLDRGTPAGALNHFYRGFNGRSLSRVSENWSRETENSMDNPLGGIKRGWQEISEVYKKLFNGPARVYVEFYDYTLHERGEIFYAVGRERGFFQSGDEKILLAIRTTRIYERKGDLWFQGHHHGSIEAPNLLSRYQKAVRRTP